MIKEIPECKISVVMPFYNAEAYLAESIESILNQTFNDFELLAIDDGSTDKSALIVTSFNDKRIKLITRENNFVDSLNYGLKISQGKYIARMDADDVMLPERLQVQYNFLEEFPDIDLCGSWAESFGGTKNIMKYEKSHDDIISAMLLYNCIIHPTVIMRKATLEKLKLEYKDYSYADDYKFWTDFALSGARIANIPEVLLLYRVSENQLTSKYWDNMSFAGNKIKLEYSEGIINMMIEKEDRYSDFFEQIIHLFEIDLLDFDTFLQIIYKVYHHYLKKEKSFENNLQC